MFPPLVVAVLFIAAADADVDSSSNVNATLSPPCTFTCTADEKECFRRNRLLYKEDGKCYRIGNRGPCTWGREFVVLKEPYLRNGRFVGGCQPIHRCGDPKMVLMADGSCQLVGNSAYECPYNATLHLKKNIFGESECLSAGKCKNCRLRAKQTVVEDCCVAENLSYGVPANFQNATFSLLEGRFECSALLESCVNSSTLPDPNEELCAGLLDSCEGGGWYVVDKEKFLGESTISLMCQAPRCPLGWLYMAKEVYGSNGCCSLADVQKKLCAGEDIVFNAFGEALCGRVASQESLLALPVRPAEDCVVVSHFEADVKVVAAVVSQPFVGVDDTGKSQRESYGQEEEV